MTDSKLLTDDLGCAPALTADLTTDALGRQVVSRRTVDSTNRLAVELCAAGSLRHGCVVVADSQSGGRGRLGRSWLSPPGVSILASVYLQLSIQWERAGIVPLCVGLAVAEAIESGVVVKSVIRSGGKSRDSDGIPDGDTRPAVRLKWPNDVLVDGDKCAGILVEVVNGPGGVSLVAGIGVNVSQRTFPPQLRDRATSLLLATGSAVSRMRLLAEILNRLEPHLKTLEATGWIPAGYESRLIGVGGPIRLRQTAAADVISGTMLGVDESGALRVRTNGIIRSFTSGDVTIGS